MADILAKDTGFKSSKIIKNHDLPKIANIRTGRETGHPTDYVKLKDATEAQLLYGLKMKGWRTDQGGAERNKRLGIDLRKTALTNKLRKLLRKSGVRVTTNKNDTINTTLDILGCIVTICVKEAIDGRWKAVANTLRALESKVGTSNYISKAKFLSDDELELRYNEMRADRKASQDDLKMQLQTMVAQLAL